MQRLREHRGKLIAAVVILAVLTYAGIQAVGSVAAFDRIASEEFDPDRAESEIQRAATSTTTTTTPPATVLDLASVDSSAPPLGPIRSEQEVREALRARDEARAATATVSPPLPDGMFTSVLLIGSDATGFLADVIILTLFPEDGSAPIMASIPRDLYVENPCKQRFTRINSTLGGCAGSASGEELLALAVERYTGVEVDHFARVGFSGFAAVIDRMGGVSVCAGDTPLRDRKAHLELPAGCHWVGGDVALGWVRSRQPERLIDGEWVPVGGSDFTRQRHQRQVLFQLAERLASASSVASLASTLDSLASAVRTDDGLSITEVARLGWRYRDLDPDQVEVLDLGFTDHRTPVGAWVLLPTERFNDALARVYPDAARP